MESTKRFEDEVSGRGTWHVTPRPELLTTELCRISPGCVGPKQSHGSLTIGRDQRRVAADLSRRITEAKRNVVVESRVGGKPRGTGGSSEEAVM